MFTIDLLGSIPVQYIDCIPGLDSGLRVCVCVCDV